MDSSVAAKKGVNLSSGINAKPTITRAESKINSNISGQNTPLSTDLANDYLARLDQENEQIEPTSVEEMLATVNFDDYVTEMMESVRDQDVIIFDDDNYLGLMMVIDIYPEEFIGRQVEIMGFVYRESGVQMDELVATRFVLPHCVADSSVYGLLVRRRT